MPKSLFIVTVAFFIFGCQKPQNGPPPTTPTDPDSSNCFLVGMNVSGGAGYVGNYKYDYDAKGQLTEGHLLSAAPYGSPDETLLLRTANQIGFTTGPTVTITYNYAGDLKAGVPVTGFMDIYTNGNSTSHFRNYIFSYGKGRTVTHVAWEPGELNITYDAKGDVSGMTFLTANGPRVPIAIVTVEGYDDKHTPFAAMGKFWKFVQHMFSWDYFDEYLMVTALSNHNPGKITIKEYLENDKYQTRTFDMQYFYNSEGNLETAIVKQTDAKGVVTTYQTANYAYDCR